MKPTPPKPRIIIAQVEGSGDATRGRRGAWPGAGFSSNSSCQRDDDQRLARGISFTRQPNCDHMLRKSCSRTACHKRCPTHPPLAPSSHPPGPSPASTATRRRPPASAPPSHRSRHAALPVRWRPAEPVRDCQDLSPPQPALPSACGAARTYRRETLPSSAGRCRTDDHKTSRPRLPKSVQPWQNCLEPVRLVSASLQLSTRSNENLLVVATEDCVRHRCQICATPPSTHRSMPVTK